MTDGTVSSFRKKRGKILSGMLVHLSEKLDRPVSVLDVGGRRDYWENVGFEGIGTITLVNYDANDLNRSENSQGVFTDILKDTRNLKRIIDQEFDISHSNAIIEQIGN